MRTIRRRTFLVVAAVAALAACGRTAPSRPAQAEADVYLVIVDGLGADVAVPEYMPRLTAAARRRRGSWLTATAVMPSLTNPNHASLLTGVHPDAHGITGNRHGNGSKGRDLDDPRLLEMETLFTAIARQRPAFETVAVFGKSKLRHLFAEAPGQRAPGTSWPSGRSADYVDDVHVMTEFRALVRARRPRFGVVAIADVDHMGHHGGPRSAAYLTEVEHADVLVAGFLDELRRDGRWRRSVVIVTADHGFLENLPGTAGSIETRRLQREGAAVVGDCRVAHVYAAPGEGSAVEGALRAIAERAGRHPGVQAVYALSGSTAAPPPPDDWHLRHARGGDLLLVARPGFAFVDGPTDPVRRFRGNHGTPAERLIPLVVTGGHPALRKMPPTLRPSSVDVAPTIARLLGIDAPRRLDGLPVPAASRGRVLDEMLAP